MIIKAVVGVEVHNASGECCVGVFTVEDCVRTDETFQCSLAAVDKSLRHSFASGKTFSFAL